YSYLNLTARSRLGSRAMKRTRAPRAALDTRTARYTRRLTGGPFVTRAGPHAAPCVLVGCRDRLAEFFGGSLAADVGRARRAAGGVERLFDGGDDVRAGFRVAQVVEHHRARPDRADRVRDALAGDVGGRSMHRLEQRRMDAIGIDVAGRRDAD